MDIDKTKEKINKDREKTECCFVFCLWRDPTLYDDYKEINSDFFKSEDSKFYYLLGKTMREQGLNSFDNISTVTFLSTRPEIERRFNQYGGWHEVEQLRSMVNTNNINSYYDDLAKRNNLETILLKYEEIFNDVDRFKNASSEDVYETFDLLNNSISLNSNREAKIENMIVSEQDIKDFNSGEAVGLSYGKAAPLLNYTTLGLPKGDIYMVAGHSGSGKSSFTFNMAINIVSEGTPVCILSNEMQLKAYKNMLLAYVLSHDLNYWNLTRKKLKIGDWSDEELEMVKKASEIIKEKYSNLFFIKLFDNDGNIVMKQMKKINRLYKVETFIWDTYKSDDTTAGSDKMWQELLLSSRKVFNLIAKEQWYLVCTFQLALYTTNQRYLDAGCLSSSKQVKEIISELVMVRKLWDDEYTGEKFDCHPFKFNKENKKIKETIDLDKSKTYVVAIIDKTRNDENAKNILFQWDSTWNRWTEIGYCSIRNDHKGV